jgi:hypothetical protein
MDSGTKTIFDVVLGITQTAIVIGGTVWAYFRFFREGVHKPRIEFDVECSFLGPQQGRYVAAFMIHAINRGNVEHRFSEIRLRVRGIKSSAALNAWKDHEPLLEFPDQEFETVNIVPKELEYYFVRPGIDQRFSFVTSVPAGWRFIITRATFKYETTDELHTAEKAFEVKAANAV